MAYNRQQSVSKPLLIGLVVVAVVAALYWFVIRGVGPGKEETAQYGPKPPDNLPATPPGIRRGPQPIVPGANK